MPIRHLANDPYRRPSSIRLRGIAWELLVSHVGVILKVTERFKRVADDRLYYGFTVEDPTLWDAPWGGEYEFAALNGNMYEYACHEGNYAMHGILSGARVQEAKAAAAEAEKAKAAKPAKPAKGKGG